MNYRTPSRTYFENSQPILRVGDMKAALAFYVDKLGFQNASSGTEDFTSVNRDRAGIYLCRGGQGRGPAWSGSASRTPHGCRMSLQKYWDGRDVSPFFQNLFCNHTPL